MLQARRSVMHDGGLLGRHAEQGLHDGVHVCSCSLRHHMQAVCSACACTCKTDVWCRKAILVRMALDVQAGVGNSAGTICVWPLSGGVLGVDLFFDLVWFMWLP